MVSGLIGAVISSILMSKTKKYKLMIWILTIAGTVFHFLLYITVGPGVIWPVILFPILIGLVEMPARGVIIAFSCEVAYPVGILQLIYQ